MTLWPLIIAILLLVGNGFFVGAEFALTAARRTKLAQLEATGNSRARYAMKSIRELSLMLAGAQLGITMMSFGLGYLAEPAVATLIERALVGLVDLPDSILHSVSFIVALSIVVFLHMVIGEMAPKNIAIAEPERSALGDRYSFPCVRQHRSAVHLPDERDGERHSSTSPGRTGC